MKKRRLKKLVLGKETLNNLEHQTLDQVAAAEAPVDGSGTTCSGVWCSQYWTQCFCM